MLKGKRIVLGITGSIAAYKAAVLVRLLVKEGASVQVVMTPAALGFITPLTLSTLSGNPVLIEPFHDDTGKWNSHIDWATWADLLLIAPLTANTLSKMASGQVDNLLLAIYMAARCPVFFAPAMDVDMYEHPANQRNLATLHSDGKILIPPGEGFLASGLNGKGRMMEPEEIVSFLRISLKKKSQLIHKKVLVTAGPTHEKLDAVRYIGNYSSGRMGYALAEEFASRGSEVTLISGPVHLGTVDESIKLICVTSAKEMHQACLDSFSGIDITVMAAAVADYTAANVQHSKIKKTGKNLNLELVPSTDILADLGNLKTKKQFLAGFALETDHEALNARQKLVNKNLDMIILNSLNDAGAGFGHHTNKISIIDRQGNQDSFALKSKREVASDIVDHICQLLNIHD